MDPTTTSTQGEKPIILQIEIWQSQSYGAIKGWKIPSRSTPPHYTCSLFPNGGSENFPEDLNPPTGWDWHDKWTIDTSNAFGQSDSNGWYFGPTFEKLTELLETNSATGISSKSSMVRMRRWVRSIVCTSIDLQKKITSRIEEIIQQRKHVENIYKDKEEAFKSIKFYEENRSFVFAQSLHLATQGILNTLSILKELINKLKLLKQFLGDRIEMEKQHASSLDALAKRYWLKSGEESEETTPRGSANRMLERQASLQKLIEEQPTSHETSAAPTSIPSSSDNGVLQCANIFFSGIHRATEAVCNSKSAFATNLLLLMNNEVSELLTEVQTVLKEARATFRKNSDICRLSESAIINFSSSLQIAFDSVASFAMEEIALLTNELTILRGGSTFQPHIFEQLMKPPADDDQANLVNPSFHATSNLPPIIMSSPSVRTAGKRKKAQREDMWLSVQRYKVAVRDSQEALCVLISESMDLELQQQILTNRVHNMFVYVIDNYLTEELTLSSDTDLIYTGLMKSIQEKIETIGVPNPILQSPFAKLNPALSMLSGSQDSFKGEEGGGGGGVQNNSSDEAAKEYEDFINSVGIFSFTTLFKEPLPVNPGVIKSGYLLTVRPSELLFQNNHHDSNQTASESKVPDSITVEQLESSKLAWREAYVVATSDGYLHIIYGRKSEIPARSFYMKNSYLNEYVPSLPIEELREKIFEIFMMATAVQQTKKNGSVRKGSARIIEGLYLQTNSSDEKKEWIYALKNLTNLPSHVDKVIEEEASVSMLESLPILKGETAKIDLEMKNYEKYQQENRPVTLSSASRLQSFSIENNHRDDYMNRAEAMATSFTSPFAEKGNDGTVGSESFNSGSVEKEGVSEEVVDKEEERKTENDTVRRENQRPDSKTGSMDNEEEDTGLQLQTNFCGKYGSQNDSDSDVASPSPFNLLHHLSPDQRNQIAEEKDRRAITIKTNNSSDSNSLSPLNNIQFAGSDDIGFFTSQSEDRQTSDENDSFYHYSKSYFHLPNEKLLPALFESVEEEHEDEQKDSLHHEAHKEEGKQEEVKEEVITQEAEVPQKKEGKTEISEIDEDNTLPPLPTGYSLIDKTTEKKESDAAETGNSEADFFNTNLNLHYETDSDDDSSTGLEANRRFRPQAHLCRI